MDTRIAKRTALLGFIVILGSLFYYQVIKGNYYLERSRANYIRVIPQDAIRGSIMDVNKKVIARDEAAFDIDVVPYQIRKDKCSIFHKVSMLTNVPERVIKNNYKRNIKNPFSPVDIAVHINKSLVLRAKDELGDKIIIKSSPYRFYPFSYDMSHILGYVKFAAAFYSELKAYGYTPYERVGFLGIEQYYDSYLRGKEGGKLVEVDSSGRIVGFLGESLPQRGKNITLTIDSRIQEIAYKALSGHIGVIILMDPYTGGIVALCSRPSYNVNNVTEGKRLSRLLSDKRRPFINRAIQSAYPLGSVFKPILAAAALQEGIINKDTTFDCKGFFMLGNHKFSCWTAHGIQNVTEALAHSCNVFFYNTGLKLGIKKMALWARKFGLGRLTGIDLPYEKKGIMPDPIWKKKHIKKQWFAGDTVNTSIGQGYLKATPIQAVVAISAFANGGYIVRPHILKEVGQKETVFVKKNYLNISLHNLNIVREGLYDVVHSASGTAHLLDSLGMDIAGKTGTAQNAGAPHGWFAGFFPFNKPKYSICVFLENAGSSHEAVKVAYKFLTQLRQNGLIKITK